jgi:hypothetical protein
VRTSRLTESDDLTASSTRPDVDARPAAPDRARRGIAARAARWWGRHPRSAWAAGLTIAALVLFLCYLREARALEPNSDPAGQALQAWQMWHGNPLLRGWWLGDVSFYTVELPLNVVIEMIVGLGPGEIHVLAAVVYTAVLLLAAMLARGRARGWAGVTRALLAAGIMLAPSAYLGTRVLLQGPDHVGTMIPVLAAFLVLDRAPARWWVPVIVGLLLTGAQVNDEQATFAGALALAVACGVRAWGLRAGPEIGRRRRPPPERWFDVSLAAAALASIAAAHVILLAIHGAGGFLVPPPKNGTGFAAAAALPGQARTTVANVLILFGANVSGQPTGLGAAFAVAHFAGLALGLAALLTGAWRFFGRLDRVGQALVAGTLIILAAGALGQYMAPVTGAHEILPVLPFAAVLAGRLFGGRLAGRLRIGRLRIGGHGIGGHGIGGHGIGGHGIGGREMGGRLAAPRLAPVLAVGLAVMVAALAYNDVQPEPPPGSTPLATWLEAHHLASGLAGYWESNITTVDTGGRVRLASVTNGGTTAEPYESDATWYDPARYQANFIVSLAGSQDLSPVTPARVRAWYGTPERVYRFDGYTVMVYDYNLLTRVIVPAGPWKGFRPG